MSSLPWWDIWNDKCWSHDVKTAWNLELIVKGTREDVNWKVVLALKMWKIMIFMEAFCQVLTVIQLTILMFIHLCGILGYVRAWTCCFSSTIFYFSYNTRNPITLDPYVASINGNALFLLSNMATSEILSCPQPCYLNFPITNDLLPLIIQFLLYHMVRSSRFRLCMGISWAKGMWRWKKGEIAMIKVAKAISCVSFKESKHWRARWWRSQLLAKCMTSCTTWW